MSFIYRPLTEFTSQHISREFQDCRISNIKPQDDISKRDLKEIQNDFSILKTNTNLLEKDFDKGSNMRNMGHVSNLMISDNKPQFPNQKRNQYQRKNTMPTISKTSIYTGSFVPEVSNLLKEVDQAMYSNQKIGFLDSKIKDQIVKSNIEKNKAKPKMQRDQLVNNRLISPATSQDKQPKRVTPVRIDIGFKTGEKHFFENGQIQDFKALPGAGVIYNHGKATFGEEGFKSHQEENEDIGGLRSNQINSANFGHSQGRETFSLDSQLESESSRKTKKATQMQLAPEKSQDFAKKNHTYHAEIQKQDTRKKLHQKHNSLSILGFKTNQNSIENLLKQKKKKSNFV